MNAVAQIAIPFALEQELWWTGHGHKEEWVTCPECLGTKALTLIQGNGEQVSLDCGCCTRGYESPSGKIMRHIYQHTPTRFVPRRVDIRGDEISYSESSPSATSYSMVYAKDLYATAAECAIRCKALNEERAAHDLEMEVRQLSSKRRDMAWSVHYWGREVKELERKLEVARARLARCKVKPA